MITVWIARDGGGGVLYNAATFTSSQRPSDAVFHDTDAADLVVEAKGGHVGGGETLAALQLAALRLGDLHKVLHKCTEGRARRTMQRMFVAGLLLSKA
jgi:hypothetical protein